MEKTCDLCGTLFDTSTRNRGKGRHRYCSKACRSKAHNQQYWRRHHVPIPPQELVRICVACGVTFQTDKHHLQALTCSVKCNEARQNAARRRATAQTYDALPQRECTECGTLFKPNKFTAKCAKYCSRKCADKFRRRESGRKRQLVYGQYNKRLVTSAWKKARIVALQRDHRTCRVCGNRNKIMAVHHLFDEHDHAPENLITVCRPCHHDLHSFSIGKVNGHVTISGAIFKYLGIAAMEVR